MAGVSTGVEGATAPKVARHFHVIDAETNQPVAGATVVATHHFNLVGDWEASGQTDGRGEVTLRIANRRLFALTASVTAPGYLRREAIPLGKDEAGGPGPLAQRDITYPLYREPLPAKALRVPAGFRGVFLYTFGPEPRDFYYPPDFPPGQRVWWTDLQPDGVTVIEHPPQLGSDPSAPGFSVVTADGQPISRERAADGPGVAVWQIGTRTPRGPGGDEFHVVAFIGDKQGALAAADAEDKLHPDERSGRIDDYWLRQLGRWPRPRR